MFDIPDFRGSHSSMISLCTIVLRKELKNRHEDRMDRLTCLLRATELVQALGQPQGGSLTGMLNTYALRPLTRLTPNAIKKPIFNAVLKDSLGL